jgi:hypothetical protein
MIRRLTLALTALLAIATILEVGATFVATGTPSVAQPAEARVGRPLTPVSYAGVARRTVRRCAAGVYYC